MSGDFQDFIYKKSLLNNKLEDGKITPKNYHKQVEELRSRLIKIHHIERSKLTIPKPKIKRIKIMVWTDNPSKWGFKEKTKG